LRDRLFTQLPKGSYTIRVDPTASVAPVRETLVRVFDKQPVSVTAGSVDQSSEIEVLRDGTRVAGSSVDELFQSLLLVNSDVYISGSRPLAECILPDVLWALQEIPFLVRGYPESDTEKLLLIAVSREIERIAYTAATGTLRVGFQQLSRLVDEPGTYRIYEQLCETDLDIHVYGVENVPLPTELDLTVHTGSSQLYRHGWFVVFQPETTGDPAATRAALFSTEREPNRWGGFWTDDPDRVDAIAQTILESTSSE